MSRFTIDTMPIITLAGLRWHSTAGVPVTELRVNAREYLHKRAYSPQYRAALFEAATATLLLVRELDDVVWDRANKAGVTGGRSLLEERLTILRDLVASIQREHRPYPFNND